MAHESEETRHRTPRRTATFRGHSRAYYGFTEFRLDEPLPHAAGVYFLVSEIVGPERWRVLLIGDTANFAAGISSYEPVNEAKRRGASRILLHFSPLAAAERLQAAQDLWMAIRSPLVTWDSGALTGHNRFANPA